MQGTINKRSHTGNGALFIIVSVIYAGVLLLFGWQTWGFVTWLFPSDQLLMQVLTLLCFDVMAFIWAVVDLFYRHATRSTRAIVRWGWGFSFVLSFLASVLYLIVESFFRFRLSPSAVMVNVGYGITIIAVTVTVLLITFWLYSEWSIRHPSVENYAYEDVAIEPAEKNKTLAQPQNKTLSPGHIPAWFSGDGAEWEEYVEGHKGEELNTTPLAVPGDVPGAVNGHKRKSAKP